MFSIPVRSSDVSGFAATDLRHQRLYIVKDFNLTDAAIRKLKHANGRKGNLPSGRGQIPDWLDVPGMDRYARHHVRTVYQLFMDGETQIRKSLCGLSVEFFGRLPSSNDAVRSTADQIAREQLIRKLDITPAGKLEKKALD